MNTAKAYIQSRGTQIHPVSRFDKYGSVGEQLCSWRGDGQDVRTRYIAVQPKALINSVKTPDLNFAYSLNPFRGGEHGRIYSNARNPHNYWGYSSDVDFQKTILIKQNAATLLAERLRSPSWDAKPIMLSGNTDCYQPVEEKLGITRDLLQVFWRYRHPVQIITKNDLILRDLDYLKLLASENLVQVAISLTSMDDDLRGIMEPGTSTIAERLNTIKVLADNGIPVVAMLAPIIPNINDHEMHDMIKAVAEAGACDVKYVLVKLKGDVANIFKEWARNNFPEKADRVIKRIEAYTGGVESSIPSEVVGRKGGSSSEDMIDRRFQSVKLKCMTIKPTLKLNLALHKSHKVPQLQLFR